MGYYTTFTLIADCSDEELEKIIQDAKDIDIFLPDEEENYLKWYEWRADMMKVSGMYPHILFTLEGWGRGTRGYLESIYQEWESSTSSGTNHIPYL